MTPTPHSVPDRPESGGTDEAVRIPKRRPSRTEIAVMEQIDIRYEAKSGSDTFTRIQPINQQQAVRRMSRSSRNSLGQNALKDDVEQLRKEYEANLLDQSDEEGHIVDVQEMSDNTNYTMTKEEEDDFLSDNDVAALRTKYVSMTTDVADLPMAPAMRPIVHSHSAKSPQKDMQK